MREKIYLFRCGSFDLYGLTREANGENLPSDACAGAWRLIRPIEFEGEFPPWGMDIGWQERAAAAQAGLALNGYFLSEGAALPGHLLEDSEQ